MKKMLAVSLVLTLGFIPLTQTSASAADYKTEYRLSTVLGPAFSWGKAGERWSELVKQKTDGRISIKLYPGTSLVGGDQTREFSAIRQGVIDLAIGSSINWSPQVKQLNLFSLPFLTPDEKSLDALIKGEVGKTLFAVLDKQGVVPLAYGENGFRELSNSRQPIKTPADLKGMKIRVVGSPIFLDAFAALGANPTQMSWADAQPALATKAVDGQENPLSVFNAAKLHTLGQNHLTLWGYMTDPLIFVVNKDIWASWTPADQAVVRQAALDAGKQEIEIARKGLIEAGQPLLKDIAAMGVNVVQLTAPERDAFVQATRPVYEKWKKTIGADLVATAEKAIAMRKK